MCGAARDGASTLVTRGALRMSARDRRDQAIPSKPSTTENVRFDLTAIGYAVPPGRRTSLSLSPPLLLLLALDLARAGPGARLHPGPVGPFPRTPVAGKGVRPRDHTESPPPPRYPRPPDGLERTEGAPGGVLRPGSRPPERPHPPLLADPSAPSGTGPGRAGRLPLRSHLRHKGLHPPVSWSARAATRWSPIGRRGAADPARRGSKPRRPLGGPAKQSVDR
ncbi:CocE/NonD family hydrolase C-terminal non-catalytic domain-containing protein [Streptomyces sp. LN325]|uniref:CocE/NonD family hydrolase C-terminal non-catalytic domain-containing protein n=1 Tax=Streptomyces sp. LN325 TaxID=3112976 RepID=UPI00371963A1